MLHTPTSRRGMVTAPHHLAARAGLRVLEDGGNAIEAMIAAASTIAAVYPHMNGLGGDNFWLIHTPGGDVTGIDACGAAAANADISFYKNRGFAEIPSRGPLAALTVAGAVSGWQDALQFSADAWGGQLPLERLLEDAIYYAGKGVAVTQTLANNIHLKRPEMDQAPGFGETFLIDGREPVRGQLFQQPRLAETLRRLAQGGLDSFYRGDLARTLTADLERAGSPLTGDDLARHRALRVRPLTLQVAGHQVYNMPPPTQGLASLMLLGIYERLGITDADGYDFIHGLVEATKRAFRIRDSAITDPAYMSNPAQTYLTGDLLDSLARDIRQDLALPWPEASARGDTVWLGAVDGQGRAVSFIQSIYWEFGSGTVLQDSGIAWQNRGVSFSLDDRHHNCLKPHRRPFHTIQPALARLADGRVMPYGTMGGEGQPQTQAMIFARHVLHGQELQQAITQPRWLLGRTWGAESTSLKMESRFDATLTDQLRAAGHVVEMTGPFDEVMGHAGALVHHPDGLIEGAADPRGDGLVAGF